MTPFELDILLHYYSVCSEHEVVSKNPPIWAGTRDWFLKESLLELSDGKHPASYKTTRRANIFIEHILELPLPDWKMP
jgi:hypothetical protein